MPTSENINSYVVDVYRSESVNSLTASLTEFDCLISGVAANSYSYMDTAVSGLINSNRTWFYNLKIRNTLTNAVATALSTPTYFNAAIPDPVFREIIRRKKLVLNNPKMSGRTFSLIKRRTWGVHCPDSWDEILMRDTNPDCPTCKGTGWVNGFFAPIKFKGMVTSSPKYNQITMYGEWMPSDVLLTTLGYPPIKPKDIIVDDKRQMWVARQIRPIERLGHTIEQSIQMSLISTDDIIYKSIV